MVLPVSQQQSASPRVVDPELAGTRILIVDDNAALALLICKMLERFQCAPRSVASSQEALRVVGEGFQPQLLILDIVMPEGDGLALCRRIRNELRLDDLPILMLTAVQDPEIAARAMECGADDYLVKPMHLEGLINKVRILMRLARQHRLPSGFYRQLGSTAA